MEPQRHQARLVILSLLLLPWAAAGGTGRSAYRAALPGYKYQFPRDHFEHQDFRTEWWYFTGNVTGAKGERFGFELVFFRHGNPQAGDAPLAAKSSWSVHDYYLAHAALTDVKGKRFWYDERLNRPGPGLAGASFEKRRIWNGNWSVTWRGEVQELESISENFRFHLLLSPQKPFVIHGENGVSQKGDGPGRASHYVSFPLLAVSGSVDGQAVTGRAWMDHEWFTEELAPEQSGWDWFSIQLDNQTELMLFDLRRKDGSADPHSSGTFIDAEGVAHHLRHEDFTLEPLARWGRYPTAWRIRVPSLQIDIRSNAVMQDQELHGKQGGPTYWEGAVDYTGTHTGVGYVEMTGYEGAITFGQ